MVSTVADIDIAAHDRYLIYDMLGRKVTFNRPTKGMRRSGKKLTGVVEQVCRNIFENVVELTLSGQLFIFSEPVAIISDNGHLLFVYGDIDATEMTDDELFDEMRDSADKGETVNDVLARTRPRIIKVVRFQLGDVVLRRGKTWRKNA